MVVVDGGPARHETHRESRAPERRSSTRNAMEHRHIDDVAVAVDVQAPSTTTTRDYYDHCNADRDVVSYLLSQAPPTKDAIGSRSMRDRAAVWCWWLW